MGVDTASVLNTLPIARLQGLTSGCGADPEIVHELLNEVFKDYEGTVEFWIYEPSH